MIKPPCDSCPYRRDAKLALWHRSEFENLLAQDREPFGGDMFACHGERKKPPGGRLICGGWALDQKRRNVPSIRFRLFLMKHAQAREALNALTGKGLRLYASIQEMVRANFGPRVRARRKA